MKNFRHFIITRFNLPLYAKDKKNSPTRTDGWLRDRFGIFEAYCLPSVAAQECRDFTWLCLFDADTPGEYRERIEGYRGTCPAFTPVFYDGRQTQELAASLDRTIRDIVDAEGGRPEWIISTNLDNDDALSVHAVGALRERIGADGDGVKVYSFLYGYQYFAKPHLVTKMSYSNNHFLTLAEPYGEGRLNTIISFRHAAVTREMETVYVETPDGMWLEVVHASNVANEFRINSRVKYITVMRSRDFSDFGLAMRVSGWGQFWKTITLFPAYFISTGVRRLATKKQRRREMEKKRQQAQ